VSGGKREKAFRVLTGGRWGGVTTMVSQRRRAEATVLGARWEGNTGADGASRCEDWKHGVEMVL
jgi:hypothetical protein